MNENKLIVLQSGMCFYVSWVNMLLMKQILKTDFQFEDEDIYIDDVLYTRYIRVKSKDEYLCLKDIFLMADYDIQYK
jgi:hypothetical protein